jgi:hypothetical protein
VEHGAQPVLREFHGLDAERIARVAADLAGKREKTEQHSGKTDSG